MKLFTRGAWLGWAVLVSFAWYVLTFNHLAAMHSAVQACVFAALFFLWMTRGIIRAIGRAWRHSATKA